MISVAGKWKTFYSGVTAGIAATLASKMAEADPQPVLVLTGKGVTPILAQPTGTYVSNATYPVPYLSTFSMPYAQYLQLSLPPAPKSEYEKFMELFAVKLTAFVSSSRRQFPTAQKLEAVVMRQRMAEANHERAEFTDQERTAMRTFTVLAYTKALNRTTERISSLKKMREGYDKVRRPVDVEEEKKRFTLFFEPVNPQRSSATDAVSKDVVRDALSPNVAIRSSNYLFIDKAFARYHPFSSRWETEIHQDVAPQLVAKFSIDSKVHSPMPGTYSLDFVHTWGLLLNQRLTLSGAYQVTDKAYAITGEYMTIQW